MHPGPDAHGRRPGRPSGLKGIEGRTRGISRMVTDDRACVDVLTGISAATRALQQVAVGLQGLQRRPRLPRGPGCEVPPGQNEGRDAR
nr:metal-sensing transcriptional repressor [Streptomyces toyocaensis]